MATRLLLSLKKSNSKEYEWDFTQPASFNTMVFAEGQGGNVTKDEVHMETFREHARSTEELKAGHGDTKL